jgi:hypothetical protein
MNKNSDDTGTPKKKMDLWIESKCSGYRKRQINFNF